MYIKPRNNDGYSNARHIGFKDRPIESQTKVSNFILGEIPYDGYSIKIFTMGEEYKTAHTKEFNPYFIITKEFEKDPKNSKINFLSIFKPNYFDLGLPFITFNLTDTECKDLYNFLCSYNYEKTSPLYLKLSDINYTQYSNYIKCLNNANINNENWKELPLDAGVPKYNKKMSTIKISE